MPEVRAQAIQTAGTILRDLGGRFQDGVEWQMHVTDEANTTVFKLRFSAEEPASAMVRATLPNNVIATVPSGILLPTGSEP